MTLQDTTVRRGSLAALSASLVVAVAATSASADPVADPDAKTIGRMAEVQDRVLPTNAALTVAADSEYRVDTASVFGSAESEAAPEPEPVVEQVARTDAPVAARTGERAAPETGATSETETQVQAPAAEPAAAPAPAASGSGSAAVSIARQYTWVPYVWGGTGTGGWDCIGFVGFVYRQLGIEVGRTPAAVLSHGYRVPASQARPGDIMYWPGHVGIYTGDGMHIAAWNPSMGTQEAPVWGSPVYVRVTG